MISCGARLAPFDIPQLREIMSYDELELDKLGDEKSALFFLISDTDTTYNFLVALAFSQITPADEEREFGNLERLHDNYPKYVISGDLANLSRNGIIHRNIIDFLLNP